jgi:hypothetical protein
MPRPPVRTPRSALKVEHLEDRTVPAGNVTASLLTDPDGFRTLYLQGDTADNRVTLRQLPNGLVQVHGVSTTVNGGKGVVSFANVHGLVASFSTGNDTVRTMNLNMQTVSLDGGFGDDDLAMLNTTLADGLRAASLVVTGDPDTTVVPPDTLVNGRDKIDLTGTRVTSSSQFSSFVIFGDSIEDLDTPDDIRLTDTRLTFHDAGYCAANIYGGFYGESRGSTGDAITVTNFRSEVVGGDNYSQSGLYVQGSSGDDSVRLTGIGLTHVGTGGDNYVSVDVLGTGGFDRLDATGVTVSATGPAHSYQYFLPIFECEDTRFRDWDVAIMSQLDESAGFFLPPFQPSFYGVNNLELRDVRMTTPEGGGYILIDSQDVNTGEDGFATNILFDNVQIDEEVESDFGIPCLYESYSGDDTVRIRNSRMPSFGVLKRGTDGTADVLIEGSELGSLGLNLGEWDYLAEATDTVRIRNSTIRDSADILTYGGNDTIRVSDSRFGGPLDVQGGAGDDGITVSGCTFTGSPRIDISGDGGFDAFYSAAGNDTIRVRNCTLDASDPDGVGIQGWVFITGDYIDSPDTFVGGNDVIEFSDITATVSSSTYSDLFVNIYGASVSGGGTLIGGDDDITVRDVRLHSTGVGADSFATVYFEVVGGLVYVDGTLVGDNTTIRVRDLEVVADGDGGSDLWAEVAGEWTVSDYESGYLPTVIGGDDVIEVANWDLRGGGYFYAGVFGELSYNQVRVVGGNDVISLTDVSVVSATPFGFSVSGDSGELVDSSGMSDTITLTNVSLRQVSPVPVEVGGVEVSIYADVYGSSGDDRVTLDNVTTGIVGGVLFDIYEWVWVFAEGGNDEVVIRNSRSQEFFINLGDGDDTATLTGVETERLQLLGMAGDDELTVSGSTFTGSAVDVMIAGDFPNGYFSSAAGNDTIRVIDSALRPDVGGSASLFVVGDNIAYFETGSTFVGGNDVIQIDGLTLGGGSSSTYSVSVIGDYVDGGTLIGGNDTITMRNLSIDNTVPADFGYVNLEIFGDLIGAADVVGGNDEIRLVDWALDLGITFSYLDVNIYGDYANGWDGTETEARAYVGGNDVIEVTNIHLSGQTLGPIVNFGIFGDYLIDRALVGGNDQITISDFTVPFEVFTLSISGDEVESQFFQSSIRGGNDTITVTGLRHTLAHLNNSFFGIGTDAWDPAIYLDGGHDTVVIDGCQVGETVVVTGGGHDELTVRGSTFTSLAADLGDGEDTAVIENNTATVGISVSGGAGWDTLVAWGNIAPDLFFDDFEA